VGKSWTAEETALLRTLYPTLRGKDVAARLGRTLATVHRRASLLKLGKVKKEKVSTPARSADTRFKHGARGRMWVPVGTLRVNVDGCLERKITDVGYSPRNWVPIHRLIWIEKNGPVPAGQVVVFKQGRHTTELEQITLDAVELVTRAELMRRNSYVNYPPEIRSLIQLKGSINRHVRRLSKATP
jgi:hypothetical protein